MEYTSEDSERQLAQDFEICVLHILQMHAANYVSDVSELFYISRVVFVDGNVKDLPVKHKNTRGETNQPTNQVINQPTNQRNNQPTNEPTT